MNHIWMYWENAAKGPGMPPFVRLCIESVRRHSGGATVHLLDERSVQEFLPDVRPEWHQLKKLAHKADYVRTRLVLEHGGMWLDCDMVALGSLEPLFEIPGHLDLACQHLDGAINCFVARPGCKLLREITRAQDDVIDTLGLEFPWEAIGNDLLKRLGHDYPHHRWPEWTVDHAPAGQVSRLVSGGRKRGLSIDRHAVIFNLCGASLSPLLNEYAAHRQQSLLLQQMPMSAILRRALGIPEPSWNQRLTNVAPWLDLGRGVARRLRRMTS